ncbi:MAG: TatD family hydrolase [Candidatus Bathyarchaeia archaeon]
MKTLQYVDTHIHLSDEEYRGKIEEVVSEARRYNVAGLVSNSMDFKTSVESLELAERYSGMVYAALGIHPWNVNTSSKDELSRVSELIMKQQHNSFFVAIGEVGLDYKYEKVWREQLMVFDEMLRLGEKLNLPVIIHSRGTTAQIVDMLPSYNLKRVLLHWFSHPVSVLAKAVERGYYVSEGPPTVYSNGIREVVKRVPLTNLLTETDGPVRYFRKPFEGKMTTPAFIPLVVAAIAEIKRMDVLEVAQQILRNFEEFFNLKLDSKTGNA